MQIENGIAARATRIPKAICSRRDVVALLLAAGGGLRGAGGDGSSPVRLAISESLVSDVNLNDARAAMLVWIKRMMVDLNVMVELSPKVFESTEEITHRARTGRLDSVALNVLEYRQMADLLDPSEVLIGAGETGMEQYVLLVKRNSSLHELSNLRGRRLNLLTSPKMCVAPAWLSTILDEARLGSSEQFFGPVTADTKVSRIVLPVFFGQADACVTSKRGFDTMCELNPQVAKDLVSIASSPTMVVTFYIFLKNYRSANRERFVKVLSDVRSSAAGRQLATLFQFDALAVRDAGCLASALGLLEKAQNARSRQGGGNRKVPPDKGRE